jgi:hypothetical protein
VIVVRRAGKVKLLEKPGLSDYRALLLGSSTIRGVVILSDFSSDPPILPAPSLPIRLMCVSFRDAMLEPQAEFRASGVSNE